MNTGTNGRSTNPAPTTSTRPRLGKMISWRAESVTPSDVVEGTNGRATGGHILGAGR